MWLWDSKTRVGIEIASHASSAAQQAGGIAFSRSLLRVPIGMKKAFLRSGYDVNYFAVQLFDFHPR
jgi:hypothetical protein